MQPLRIAWQYGRQLSATAGGVYGRRKHFSSTHRVAHAIKGTRGLSQSCRHDAAVSTPKISLRPYQEESINSVLEYLTRDEKRLGISLATGSGKTVIFSHLIDRVPAPTPEASQTLILAHRRELVEQAAKHCKNLYPDRIVEVEMGKQHASGVADITVASMQSLISGDRIHRFDPNRFKLVLVDEAHHIVAPGYLDILNHFKLLDKSERGVTALVGVSATFSRFDGLKLGTAIDHIVYHKDYIDMIDDGWLSKAIFTTVKSNVNLEGIKTTHGDFQTGALANAVNNDETNLLTVRSWLQKAAHRKSTLVFCVDLSHVAAITAVYRQHGIDARFITSATAPKIRAERLDAFKRGEYPVLVNCGIFTEGTDIPNVDCVVLARPTQSRNLLVQMIGRGLRLAPGKENCHIIDVVASLETGIVTTPTLFGLDPQELVDEADFAAMQEKKEKLAEEEKEREAQAESASQSAGTTSASASTSADRALRGSVTYTDYDSVADLIEDTSGERHIRALSPFAWVQIDEGKFILSNRNGDFLTIKRDDDPPARAKSASKSKTAAVTSPAAGGGATATHSVIFTRRLPPELAGGGANSKATPFARPQIIATAATFEGALRAGDKFSADRFPFDFTSKNAGWRRAPASQGQLDFLNKFRSEEEQLAVGDVDKGRAGDWITKMKHGARGRFNRLAGERRKVERKVEKREKWLEGQRKMAVKVGPVAA